MSFKTPFLSENQPKALYNFGFYKIQRQTKSILINMLKNFFDSTNKLYKLQIPEIIGVQNSDEATKIFIKRDFPYTERKIPVIVVAIKSAAEKKMYIGADNLSNYIIETTSSGETAVEIYHGAADISTAMIIVSESPETRMQYAEYINMCFTHYYRWQYFYTLGDGDMFTIVPNTSKLEFGTETEVTEGTAITPLYLVDVSMTSFIEYTFRSIDILGYMRDYEIDEDSGPTEL